MDRKTLWKGLAAIVMLLGMVIMIAWIFNIPHVVQLLPLQAPMQFNTALLLFLSALGVFLVDIQKRMAGVVGLVVLLFAAITLMQYIIGINFGIDQLFITHTVATYTSHPGRMAPNTAMCFILIGLFLTIYQINNDKKGVIEILFSVSGAVFILSFIALLGYLFHVRAAYGWGNWTAMAPQTAFGFSLLSAACFIFTSSLIKIKTIIKRKTISIVIATIGFAFFFIAWQALIMYQHENVRSLIERDAFFISNKLETTLKTHFQLINRVFKYQEEKSNTGLLQEKKSLNRIFPDYPALSAIEFNEGNDSAQHRMVLPETTESKNLIEGCRHILGRKKNIIIEDNHVVVFDNHLCIESHQHNIAVLNIKKIAGSVFSLTQYKELGFSLALAGVDIIYDSNGENEAFTENWKVTNTFELFGQTWSLSVWPTSQFIIDKTSWFPNIFLIIGIFVTVLLIMSVYLWQLSETKSELLDRKSKYIELVYSIITGLSYENDENKILSNCINMICNIIQWPIGHVLIHKEEDGSYLESARVWFFSDESQFSNIRSVTEKMRFEKGVGLPGRAWKSGKVEWIQNIYDDKNFPRKKYFDLNIIHSAIAFPVFINNKIRYVFEFFSRDKKLNDSEIMQTFSVLQKEIGRLFEKKEAQKELEISSENLKQSNQALSFIAQHDNLTGLCNRKYFEALAFDTLERAKRHNDSIAILMLDLDHFKTVNDSLGHAVGDELIKEVSNRFLKLTRKFDIIARFGGDEFAMLIDRIEKPGDVASISAKIIESIFEPFTIQNHLITISISIGIAIYPSDGATVSELLKNADLALYESKKNGKNQYSFYENRLNAVIKKNTYIENFLKKSFRENKFFLVYQPIVNIADKSLFAFEALLRCEDPFYSYFSNDDIVPIAEESGLIVPIGRWIIESALKNYAQLTTSNHNQSKIKIAINISQKQLLDPDFFSFIDSQIHQNDINPKEIIFEITETSIVQNEELAVTLLTKLREIGCEIYMDDFGTGYSSLDLIRKLPITGLKIDKRFIENIVTDPKSAGLVKLIASLAEYLNYHLITEGVETQEQYDVIKTLVSSQKAQGFFFYDPMSMEKLKELLR